VTEFVAFPNPTSAATELLCLYPPAAETEALVEIYSLSGRIVRRLEYPLGSTAVSWDTRDEDGHLVANGVYMGRLLLRSAMGSATALTKIAVMR
jgi:flagellar hook assembly protein FlgD